MNKLLLKLIIFIKFLNFAHLLNNQNWSMNIYFFYDSKLENQFDFNNIKEFKNYFYNLLNDTNSSNRSLELDENDNYNDDVLIHDSQIETTFEDEDNDDLILKYKFKFIQKINRKLKNIENFYLNIYLLDTSRGNYMNQVVNLNKAIKVYNESSEKKCKIHSKYENQHLMLFISNSKLANLFMHYWNDIPIVLVEAKTYNQVSFYSIPFYTVAKKSQCLFD
jgi:hypothetical protein